MSGRRVLLGLTAGLLAWGTVAGPGVAVAAPARTAAPPAGVQAALDRIVADGVPGVIAYGRENGRAWRATSGVADLATGAPARPNDRVRIGSDTKAFVSTVLLQLEGEHRLSLSDSVERWLPGLVPNGAAITLRELLNHTSGLYNYTDDPRVLGPYLRGDRSYYWAPRDLVGVAVSHPPLFPPGTRWSYSNTNYIVAGLVIEAVTHHDPVAEVYRRIIRPLGLTDTYFPVRDPDIRGPHAHGYLTNLPPGGPLPAGTVDVTEFSPSWAWTAGAIVSTAADLARFHRALIGGRLLRPAQQRELMTTVPAGDAAYGLGVGTVPLPCGTVWGHSGDFLGYLTYGYLTPDLSRQAVLMATSDRVLSDQAQQDISAAFTLALCGSAAGAPQLVSAFR
ncbi:MAG: serine hydrolase domain-containing protein [Mycobacteriales bacterium]